MLLLQAMPTRPFYFHEQKLHFLVTTQVATQVEVMLVVREVVLVVREVVLVLQEPLVKTVGLNLGQGSLVGFLKELGTSLVKVTRLGGQLLGLSWQVMEWVYLVGVQHC